MLGLDSVLIQSTVLTPLYLKQGSGRILPEILPEMGSRVDLLEEGAGEVGRP